MKTIINCMTISETTFKPLMTAVIYDHDMNKFLRKSSNISRESLISGDINEIIDNIKDYEIVSDVEIIKMYNDWIESTLVVPVNTCSVEFKLVENYIKSLNREEKLNNLGFREP